MLGAGMDRSGAILHSDTLAELPQFKGRLEQPVNLKRPAALSKPALFSLRQLEASHDRSEQVLWTFMRPDGRPAFNPAMLKDYQVWQDEIVRLHDGPNGP